MDWAERFGRLLVVLALGGALGASVACSVSGDGDGDTDVDGDVDTDVDTDVDADTDVDSDVDSDADTDADSDADSDVDGDADSDADGGAGELPPEDLTDCEIAEILALVNAESSTLVALQGFGLDADLARSIYRHRVGPDVLPGTDDDDPFDSVEELASVGMTVAAWRLLAEVAGSGCGLPDGEPELLVRFTKPQCPAWPDHDVPAEVRCTGSGDERSDSRAEAGIVDHVVQWIDATRTAKEINPSRDVRIVMAYLVWSDDRIEDALCAATAAGVQLEAFFDADSPGHIAPSFAEDASCNPENITISYLGGLVDYPDWRLMHIKLMLFDTGEATTRLLFGSSNMTATGSTIHFDNWVFARFPSDSHFVGSHWCIRDALVADQYLEDGSYPGVFRSTYDTCVAGLTATEDPRFRLVVTPDPDMTAMNDLIDLIEGASTSVDMAVQHFSAWELGTAIRDAGRDEAVTARLLLDDDTYYDVGDTGGTDFAMYEGLFEGEPVDLRFLQTNYWAQYGWQLQHNKVAIIDGEVLFCGAGNFTTAAFRDNYENFYFITDPDFVDTYEAEFEALFGRAKAAGDLPVDPDF